ncbi:MAG: UbiA family prenyltransferase [Bacteroidetes bacterium]|nr:UbiA family prenyltransferase [Bacteroidota bacterium]
MIYFLRLIRYKNVLMAGIAQLLVQYFLINPFLSAHQLPATATWIVICYVLSCACMGAAANVINDITDVACDNINHPSKVIINKHISEDRAFNFYLTLTATAIIIGSIPAVVYRYYGIMIMLLIIALLLYAYSYRLKGIPLLGNLVVSSVIALSIFIPMLYNLNTLLISDLMTTIGIFTLFAFLITLVREIVKCCEDYEGDNAAKINTIAVAYGLVAVRWLSLVLLLCVLGLIVYIIYLQIKLGINTKSDFINVGYEILFLIIPILLVCIKLIKAVSASHYKFPAVWLKYIMLAGLGAIVVFYFTGK